MNAWDPSKSESMRKSGTEALKLYVLLFQLPHYPETSPSRAWDYLWVYFVIYGIFLKCSVPFALLDQYAGFEAQWFEIYEEKPKIKIKGDLETWHEY